MSEREEIVVGVFVHTMKHGHYKTEMRAGYRAALEEAGAIVRDYANGTGTYEVILRKVEEG